MPPAPRSDLGADEVILLYRRTRNEMPANMIEIEAAEHEGIKMEFLAAPMRVNVANDRMESITCIRMELGEPDSSGRRRPVEVKDSEYTLECDWVISAIGQEPDLAGVEDGNGKRRKSKSPSGKRSSPKTARSIPTVPASSPAVMSLPARPTRSTRSRLAAWPLALSTVYQEPASSNRWSIASKASGTISTR